MSKQKKSIHEPFHKDGIMFRLQFLLYWLPRILGIVSIIFLGLFALDVFIPGKPFWEITVALLIHLIPNFLLLIVLFIAWKHEIIGGGLFISIGLLFTLFYKTYEALPNFLFISFPVFLIGLLFFFNAMYQKH